METVLSIFNNFFTGIYNLLPNSPFNRMIELVGDIPYLAELNWFIPIPQIIAVAEIWLTAITVYYLYSAIMRFIRLVK